MDESILNILLLGDSSVGKTSLMIRFTNNEFEDNGSSTIGIEFKNKKMQLNDKEITLHILDTAGQERYRSIAKNFFRKGDGIIYVFDLTNEKSYKSIKNWLMDVDEVNKSCQKILVGNKTDLKDYRVIDRERAKKFSESHNLKYFETSAKDGSDVELIFKEIAELILSNKSEKKMDNKITLSNQPNESKKSCCKNK